MAELRSMTKYLFCHASVHGIEMSSIPSTVFELNILIFDTISVIIREMDYIITDNTNIGIGRPLDLNEILYKIFVNDNEVRIWRSELFVYCRMNMMLSRCNFHAVTLAHVRLNVLGHRPIRCRPFVSCSVCMANGKSVMFGGCLSGYRPRLHDQTGEKFRLSRDYASDGKSPSPPPPPPMDDDRSQGIFQRFKIMAKNYWYIVLPVHIVTSTVWFGSFYFIASCGVDIPALLESLGFPNWIIDKVRDGNSWTSYLVIAYGLYKIFTPLRYMVTLGGTGMTIRYLQKLGYAIGGPKKP